jgi:hypothetical protein
MLPGIWLRPPEEPLTSTDKGEIRLSIADLRELLAKPSVDADAVRQAAKPFFFNKQKVADWLGQRLTVAVDTLLALAVVALYHHLDDVIRLISHLH